MKQQIAPTLAIDEEIRDIKGYEGQYAITSCGRVWSYKSHKFLSPGTTSGGYCFVILCKNGKTKLHTLHRLVAEAFLANPDGLPEVNHKDEHKDNNCLFNLEWSTVIDNRNYGTRNEKIANKNSFRVHCIELDKVWERAALAAEEMGITANSIRNACNGKTKTCRGYHWEYVA